MDYNILDQLIKGTAHSQVRTKLLDHNPTRLSLDIAMDMARTFEATEAQLQQFRGEIPVLERIAIKKTTSKIAVVDQNQETEVIRKNNHIA